MSHFGYSLEKLPEKFMARLSCLAAVYAPVDGINEKGLCTSIMALPNQASQQDTPKPNVGTTIIMRLWLDRCATVQEALDLLETVDVCHDAAVGSGYHYMVADANGDCAVVEFDKDGKVRADACGYTPQVPAEYSFVEQQDGRGVFSFCMCPGGEVVAADRSFIFFNILNSHGIGI